MNSLERHSAAFPPGSAEIVLNALPHPVLLIGPDGRIGDANVSAEAFFEVSMPLLRRHALRELVPFGSPLLALVEQVRTRGAPVNEYRVDLSTGEYLRSQLKKIGWNASLHTIAGADYFRVVGTQATKAQIGFTNWLEFYPYPSDWFDILQNGDHITKVHNNNYGNVDINSINEEIDRLDSLPPAQALSPSTNTAWAKIDRDLMVKYASTAPYLNATLTSFVSTQMNPDCDVFTDSQDDLAQFCLK